MTAYAITGTLEPDVTTENTGEPAGVLNGEPYWSWAAAEVTWFLFWDSGQSLWFIGSELGGLPLWTSATLVGPYDPFGSSGIATVAEYAPPTSDPRLRGVLKLLITHVNGTELNPAKRFELEFDS